MWIALQDVFKVHFHVLLVGVGGLMVIDEYVLATEMMLAEQWLELNFTRHICTLLINEL